MPAPVAGRRPFLSGRQTKAIAALLNGMTVTAAAAEAGVSRQTLGTWLREDDLFVSTLERERVDLWAGLVTKLESLGERALATLGELLAPEHDPKTRLAAAEAVLARVRLEAVKSPGRSPEAIAAERADRALFAGLVSDLRAVAAQPAAPAPAAG